MQVSTNISSTYPGASSKATAATPAAGTQPTGGERAVTGKNSSAAASSSATPAAAAKSAHDLAPGVGLAATNLKTATAITTLLGVPPGANIQPGAITSGLATPAARTAAALADNLAQIAAIEAEKSTLAAQQQTASALAALSPAAADYAPRAAALLADFDAAATPTAGLKTTDAIAIGAQLLADAEPSANAQNAYINKSTAPANLNTAPQEFTPAPNAANSANSATAANSAAGRFNLSEVIALTLGKSPRSSAVAEMASPRSAEISPRSASHAAAHHAAEISPRSAEISPRSAEISPRSVSHAAAHGTVHTAAISPRSATSRASRRSTSRRASAISPAAAARRRRAAASRRASSATLARTRKSPRYRSKLSAATLLARKRRAGKSPAAARAAAARRAAAVRANRLKHLRTNRLKNPRAAIAKRRAAAAAKAQKLRRAKLAKTRANKLKNSRMARLQKLRAARAKRAKLHGSKRPQRPNRAPASRPSAATNRPSAASSTRPSSAASSWPSTRPSSQPVNRPAVEEEPQFAPSAPPSTPAQAQANQNTIRALQTNAKFSAALKNGEQFSDAKHAGNAFSIGTNGQLKIKAALSASAANNFTLKDIEAEFNKTNFIEQARAASKEHFMSQLAIVLNTYGNDGYLPGMHNIHLEGPHGDEFLLLNDTDVTADDVFEFFAVPDFANMSGFMKMTNFQQMHDEVQSGLARLRQNIDLMRNDSTLTIGSSRENAIVAQRFALMLDYHAQLEGLKAGIEEAARALGEQISPKLSVVGHGMKLEVDAAGNTLASKYKFRGGMPGGPSVTHESTAGDGSEVAIPPGGGEAVTGKKSSGGVSGENGSSGAGENGEKPSGGESAVTAQKSSASTSAAASTENPAAAEDPAAALAAQIAALAIQPPARSSADAAAVSAYVGAEGFDSYVRDFAAAAEQYAAAPSEAARVVLSAHNERLRTAANALQQAVYAEAKDAADAAQDRWQALLDAASQIAADFAEQPAFARIGERASANSLWAGKSLSQLQTAAQNLSGAPELQAAAQNPATADAAAATAAAAEALGGLFLLEDYGMQIVGDFDLTADRYNDLLGALEGLAPLDARAPLGSLAAPLGMPYEDFAAGVNALLDARENLAAAAGQISALRELPQAFNVAVIDAFSAPPRIYDASWSEPLRDISGAREQIDASLLSAADAAALGISDERFIRGNGEIYAALGQLLAVNVLADALEAADAPDAPAEPAAIASEEQWQAMDALARTRQLLAVQNAAANTLRTMGLNAAAQAISAPPPGDESAVTDKKSSTQPPGGEMVVTGKKSSGGEIATRGFDEEIATRGFDEEIAADFDDALVQANSGAGELRSELGDKLAELAAATELPSVRLQDLGAVGTGEYLADVRAILSAPPAAETPAAETPAAAETAETAETPTAESIKGDLLRAGLFDLIAAKAEQAALLALSQTNDDGDFAPIALPLANNIAGASEHTFALDLHATNAADLLAELEAARAQYEQDLRAGDAARELADMDALAQLDGFCDAAAAALEASAGELSLREAAADSELLGITAAAAAQILGEDIAELTREQQRLAALAVPVHPAFANASGEERFSNFAAAQKAPAAAVVQNLLS